MILLKYCTQYASKFGKLGSGHRMGKIWSQEGNGHRKEKKNFLPIPKKGCAKECSNYPTIALISHASKVMPQILQARLREYVDQECPDVQIGFRKDRGTRGQIVNIYRITEKEKEFQKQHLLH